MPWQGSVECLGTTLDSFSGALQQDPLMTVRLDVSVAYGCRLSRWMEEFERVTALDDLGVISIIHSHRPVLPYDIHRC